MTAAAPSLTCDEFPAVVEPPFWKAGLSRPSARRSVPGRIPSSSVTTTGAPPISPRFGVMMGTVSARNLPRRRLSAARRWDSAAKASCSRREIPKSFATFSLVTPMGIRQSAAGAQALMPPQSSFGTAPFMLSLLMLSTPPPTPQSMVPARMACTMWATACRPLEHWRLTVDSGTVGGMPAMSCAARAMPAPPPGWSTLPMQISPSSAGLRFGTRSMAPCRVCESSASGVTTARPPRLARQMGERTAATITTSSGLSSAAAALLA
mmetsp:Transcript_14897/g.44912  ORF Transcript_14897/g.44912 Transcript_14897/m.44912 type:complete len:265 (+) Transcript_14897:447-1241(+)